MSGITWKIQEWEGEDSRNGKKAVRGRICHRDTESERKTKEKYE